MQRGAADGAAREKNGCEFGHGRERAGAPDLDCDVAQLRLGLFGRVFVGDGPARRLGGEPGAFALREGIQLDDRAVGFIGKFFTDLVQLLDRGNQFFR